MEFEESDISAGFPDPHEQEPATLRQDILDELADHLHLAMNRELLCSSGDSETVDTARQRVMERFGDPRKLARHLWRDAMQEKLMSQKILFTVLILLMLMCCGMLFQSYRASVDTRVMLDGQQAQNLLLLDQLRELRSTIATQQDAFSQREQPAEWNRLRVICTYDQPGGEPAVGVKIEMEAASTNATGIPSRSEATNDSGQIDFGQVLFGYYTLSLLTADGLQMSQRVSVHPGADQQVEIVVPRPGATGTVEFSSDESTAPESLQRRLWYFTIVTAADSPSYGRWHKPFAPHWLVRRPDGKMLLMPIPEIANMSQVKSVEARNQVNGRSGYEVPHSLIDLILAPSSVLKEEATPRGPEVMQVRAFEHSVNGRKVERPAGIPLVRDAVLQVSFSDESAWVETLHLPVGSYTATVQSIGVPDPRPTHNTGCLVGINLEEEPFGKFPVDLAIRPKFPDFTLLPNGTKELSWPIPGDDVMIAAISEQIPSDAVAMSLQLELSSKTAPDEWKTTRFPVRRVNLYALNEKRDPVLVSRGVRVLAQWAYHREVSDLPHRHDEGPMPDSRNPNAFVRRNPNAFVSMYLELLPTERMLVEQLLLRHNLYIQLDETAVDHQLTEHFLEMVGEVEKKGLLNYNRSQSSPPAKLLPGTVKSPTESETPTAVP